MTVLSIITINYNNKKGLQKTMASVIGQSYTSIEYIVIDGGSNDGSADFIKENKSKIGFWQSEKDKGIYDAMNKGIANATGEYLLFLNSGDVLVNSKVVEEAVSQFDNRDIVYGDLVTIDGNHQKQYHKSFAEMNLENLMISTIWHPCAFIKRELFSKYGLYNADFKLAGDYEFFIRAILKNGASTKYINKNISEFDKTGVSNQSKNETLMNEERELTWKLNFSDILIDCFNESVTLKRSGEYKIGKFVTKFIP